MPTEIRDSPESRRSRYFCFCPGVPYSASTRIGPKFPACTTSALLGQPEATASIAIPAWISAPPWPPSVSAIVMPSNPCAAISLATSQGYSGECARSRAPFARCFSAKRRTDSRNCSCSGVKRKSMCSLVRFPSLDKEGRRAQHAGVVRFTPTVPPRRLRRHPSSTRRGKALLLHHNEPVDGNNALAFHDQRIDLRLGDRTAGDERKARERGDGLRERAHIAARQPAVAAQRREDLYFRDHLLRLVRAHRRKPQRVVLVNFRERAARPDERYRADDRIVAVADERHGKTRFHFLDQHSEGRRDAHEHRAD